MKKSALTGLILLAFVMACRFFTPVAEFYAGYCYPVISACLSLAAGIFPFSLEEITVLVFVFLFIRIIRVAIKRKQGFLFWLKRTLVVILWLVVWFYMGWGNNYFRIPLYERAGVERRPFDREEFNRFIADYTEELNRTSGATVKTERDELEKEINAFYCQEPNMLGYTKLRKWQRTKRPLMNWLYSGVSVLGYMGPFFCESQLNLELLETEYPSTLAHEKAHLAGVTSEAEANFWSFVFCSQSGDDGVRYSGYLHLLPYVMINAKSLMTEQEYSEWLDQVSPTAIKDYRDSREYWRTKRIKVIDDIQYRLMDTMLKSNNVSQGADDYIGVVGMIITMDRWN
ncbi:MAG: DUF3810 domain-containing protein [Bacteroidaceae bacterium]|nr:DUF3810 domain-containing protein [Bacteroidaceae bacterium]